MIDKLHLTTELFINSEIFKDAQRKNSDWKYFGVNDSSFRITRLLSRTSESLPQITVLDRGNRGPDGKPFRTPRKSSIVINPSKFDSYQNMTSSLREIVEDFDPKKLRIRRLDLAVDLPFPFKSAMESAVRPNIRKIAVHWTYIHSKNADYIRLGEKPCPFVIYDKTSLYQQKAQTEELGTGDGAALGFTRFESRFYSGTKSKLPIRTLDQLHELLEFDPFTSIEFRNTIAPLNFKKNSDQAKADHLHMIASTQGMAVAVKYARATYKLGRKEELLDRYLQRIEGPELYEPYRRGLLNWFSSTISKNFMFNVREAVPSPTL